MKYRINKFLNNFNLELIRSNSNYSKKLDLYKQLILSNTIPVEETIGCIIFSMDRALQLDALLRSLFLNKIGECKTVVIYKASDENHKKAYLEVCKRFQDKVEFVEEDDRPFKKLLLNSVDNLDVGKIFFLVDDIIFTEQVNFIELSKIDTSKTVFSLRMGKHLNYSYVVDKEQILPQFLKEDENFIYWNWNDGELDWAYPLSVDGHIFNRLEIKVLIEHFDFKAPNSFEDVLQKEKELFLNRVGMSYKKAAIVNNPCNKVQSEVTNLFGTMHQDDLLKIWQDGKEIDIEKLQGYINKSVHEEIEFKFKDRK